jgi:hypothetical protein
MVLLAGEQRLTDVTIAEIARCTVKRQCGAGPSDTSPKGSKGYATFPA